MKQHTPSPAGGRALRREGRLVRCIIAILFVVSSTGVAAQEVTLELEAFLIRVEAESLQLEQFRTDRDLASIQEELARSQIFPFIGGEVGYTRNFLDIEQDFAVAADSNDPIGGAGSGIFPLLTEPVDVNSDNDYSFGVSLQQRLFDVTVFRAIEASGQFTNLTGTVYEASRQRILTGAKQLFFQTLLLEEVLAVRRASEEIARENFVDTQRRLDNGLASPLEVLQAEVNWRITQPETSQAQRNLNVALQNLKNFAGLSQADAVVLEGTLDSYPPLPSFDDAFDERADRPDYRALLSERRLREINIDAQRAQFYPSLSAQLTYGWQASDDGFDLGDPTDSFSAGLVLTVPIFFGGSRFSLLDEARLELRQVDTRIALADETIATEIETIRLVLEEAAVRIESALQTLATAERAFEVTETSLENGLATQLDLEDARVNLEQARLNHLAAVFDYLSAYFDWQLATGRGDEGLG